MGLTGKRILLFSLCAVAGLFLIVWLAEIGLRLSAPYYEQEAEQAWATSFEPMDALLARYPPAPHSAAAMTLASLAEPLGLSLLAPVAATASDADTRAMLKTIGTFLTNQESRTDDSAEALPADIVAWMSLKEAELDAIEGHLLGAEPVQWAVDLGGYAAPLPDVAALRSLSGVLLVRAFAAAAQGDWPDADRSLAASWRLDSTMRDRPDILGQSLAIALATQRNSVLRHLPVGGSGLADLPLDHDWQRAMLRAIQVDTLQFTSALRAARGEGAVFSLFSSWRSLRIHDLVRELNQADPCAFDAGGYVRRAKRNVFPWTVEVPGLVRTWSRAALIAVDDEFTRIVWRTRKAVQGGESLPGTVRSAVCGNLAWVLTTQTTGDVTIAPDRNPFGDRELTFHVRQAPGPPPAGRPPSGAGNVRQSPAAGHIF